MASGARSGLLVRGLWVDCGWIVTPPNTPHGSGRKSKSDLAGGVMVFGVSALAFCVLYLREEKKPRRNTEQGGGHGLGRKVGFACAWIVGGLRVDCGRELREGQPSRDK